MTETTILGLNAYHGDSSAALLIGGDLLAAIEEERLLRIKHWAGLPVESARRCLQIGGVERVDHIAISRDPRAHLFAKLRRVAFRPRLWVPAVGRAVNSTQVSGVKGELSAAGLSGVESARLHFVEHHRAHLASAFFASPFDEAAVVSIDGFGDFSSVMWGIGRGNQLKVRGCVRFPHSLGIFYTAFTQFLGFPKYGDEYKMMGLSAYGEPRFRDEVGQVVRVDEDQVQLDLDLFRHHSEGVDMTWVGGEPKLDPVYSSRFLEKFGDARRPGIRNYATSAGCRRISSVCPGG